MRTFPLSPSTLGDYLARNADRPAALWRCARLLSLRTRRLRDACEDTLGGTYASAMSECAQAAFCALAAAEHPAVSIEAEDAAEAHLEAAADLLSHARAVSADVEAWLAANARARAR